MRPIIVVAAMLGITACASTSANTIPALYSVPPSPTVSNTTLTRGELQYETQQTAYAAIERLRPFFLATRPSGADVHGIVPHLNVFIDGYFAGDPDILKTIPASQIESVERLQPAMAYATLGAYHAGEGVLMVRLRCRQDC
jgi:hypothetical protein